MLSWNFLCDKDGKHLDALLEVFVWSMDDMLEDHIPLDEERNALRSNPLGVLWGPPPASQLPQLELQQHLLEVQGDQGVLQGLWAHCTLEAQQVQYG